MFRLCISDLNVSGRRVVGTFSRFLSKSHNHVDVSPEVKHALETKAPLVALESTIITHGMPFPKNLECAFGVEKQIRNMGAIPATIAILNGRITIGLSPEQIEMIADVKAVSSIKTSRRDFAYVMGNKLNGGTTVSGTLIAANMVGIPIFATGGIGGVHRMGENTMDISADLIELGKTPIAVISSGVKSILDIPKTLEYLETQGVFVAAYNSTKQFPAFYTRDSDCTAPYNVTNPEEAAKIIKSNKDLGLGSGMLFAVPVPEEYALNSEEMNAVIENALHLAVRNQIRGKEITPFLLGHLAQATKGKSLTTNIALVQNNAKVAAEIAVALSKMDSITNQGTGIKKTGSNRPVVIGGSNLDRCATLNETNLKLDGRIYLGKMSENAGGVGRNICDALNKLGKAPVFITAVGNDASGNFLCNSLAPYSNEVTRVSQARTAQCIVVLDGKGDCKFLIGDMDIHGRITPELVKQYEHSIKDAPLIVLDSNPSLETMDAVLELAIKHNVPVFFEPTDVDISKKPFESKHWKAIKYITPNLLELKVIAKALNVYEFIETDNKLVEAAHIVKQVANYIDTVIVTMGDQGLILARKTSADNALIGYKNLEKNVQIRHYPALKMNNLINVNGAGDCFAAGLITAMLDGLSEEICVSVGLAAAENALSSKNTVPLTFFDKTHFSWYRKAIYNVIC